MVWGADAGAACPSERSPTADAAVVGLITRRSPVHTHTSPPPPVPLVPRALLQVHNAVTSDFSFRRSSEMRVSRVFFSGPYQPCVRMLVQGVRGTMPPVSCGFELAGRLPSSVEAPPRVHA